MSGAFLFGDDTKIKEGDTVKRTKRVASMPVGEAMIGRVINPLGQPIERPRIHQDKTIFSAGTQSAGVIQRQPVKQPLQNRPQSRPTA